MRQSFQLFQLRPNYLSLQPRKDQAKLAGLSQFGPFNVLILDTLVLQLLVAKPIFLRGTPLACLPTKLA